MVAVIKKWSVFESLFRLSALRMLAHINVTESLQCTGVFSKSSKSIICGLNAYLVNCPMQ